MSGGISSSAFNEVTMGVAQPNGSTAIIIAFPTSLISLFFTSSLKIYGISLRFKKVVFY